MGRWVELGQRLVSAGEQLNAEISAAHAELVSEHLGVGYLPLAVAHALTWTGHAKPPSAVPSSFFEDAVNFLKTGGELRLLAAQGTYAGYLGKANLEGALGGWRCILEAFGTPAAIDTADAGHLVGLQKGMFELAARLHSYGQLTGVGAWLFCAPFKIVLAHRKDLWGDENVNDVNMPLGIEVIRGVRRLISDGSPWTRGVDEAGLSEEEGTILEGMGTVVLVQNQVCRPLAREFSSSVIHANSGLYLYGRGEVDTD